MFLWRVPCTHVFEFRNEHQTQHDSCVAVAFVNSYLCSSVLVVGLSVDVTEWVKAGLISHDEMIGRNWAHWAMFSLVSTVSFPFFCKVK